MASRSYGKQYAVAMTHNDPTYPYPLARYEDVVGSQKLFMATLERLHFMMGTKFMIPIVGGKELDLHKLFVEVTSRGGIEKIINEKRWSEVTATFSFPPTATNASFVLRKYYYSLLHCYAQIYFFKPQQSVQVQPRIDTASSTGSHVNGVIDGKFESGYLISVTIGSEKLKGVLYQIPKNNVHGVSPDNWISINANSQVPSGSKRRRRRKKWEIKRRDPSHPKPNRSGYNFFFAEQHARLKPLHPGKDREISKMIGELWNKLKDHEKSVYQGMAMEDKERYRAEMVEYREKLKMGQVISNGVSLQQRFPEKNVEMAEAEAMIDEAGEEGDSMGSSDQNGECGAELEAESGMNPKDDA